MIASVARLDQKTLDIVYLSELEDLADNIDPRGL